MIINTEGLVLRQVKAANGRRMIVLLTGRYGKISAGTSISDGGKNRTALALRPFTYGRYELFKSRDSFSINGAETLKSYFAIGEDVDKYMRASYALELADKIVQDGEPAGAMLSLMNDFLSMLSARKSAFDTLLLAFQLKVLQISGSAPALESCAGCGSGAEPECFSVKEGGLICASCAGNIPGAELKALSSRAVSAMRFMERKPLSALEGIGLNGETERELRILFKEYISHHLGIDNLKSEGLSI